jgi:2-desacetyl-2-hydroxyethyl bacteriochlorophyllide A dehydrogenase|tara:strand:- start:108 stop:1109 length:1002 start_codon:yes stop_codon:yes gene_type:complete
MKAIVFTEKNKISYQDITTPSLEKEQVLIAVRASGMCHTDLEILRGNYGSSAFPLVPGHEYAGTVVQIGDEVTKVKIDDNVVVDPNIECGYCLSCQNNNAHLCETLGAYGVTVNGGFAQYSVVHQNALHDIEDLPFHIAALAEPLGCALNGVGAVNAGASNNALIFGAGPMGLLFALAAKDKGAKKITFVDISSDRLILAESMGFNAMQSNEENLANLNKEFDLVVDATGLIKVAEKLINFVCDGGKIMHLGVCPPDAKMEIAPFEIFRRQLTIAGSHSLNHHNITEALATIHNCIPELEKIVTHKLTVEDVATHMQKGSPIDSLKIQAVWDN